MSNLHKPTLKFLENKLISLREAGKDEVWLHKWIVEKPERLSLGSFEIIAQELHQYKNKGGRLDILGFAKNISTYYEIEVMLGECDSDHGFRTLDYWAREKATRPNSVHYAVLVAENLQGRYKTLIETLPLYIPFIGIEIRTLQLTSDAGETMGTTYAEIIAQPDELIEAGGIAVVTDGKSISPRDEDWWREKQGDKYVNTVVEMANICEENIGPSRLDYTANSYISLKKGRRAWLPMWPRQDGFYVYLPDDGTGTEDEPSERFRQIQEQLSNLKIEASWAYKYNAGANPIGFALSRRQIKNTEILELLKLSYELA